MNWQANMHNEQEQVVIGRWELADIHAKLDRLDEAIRGNGTPGIKARLDRLEQIEAGRKRLTWTVVGACVSAAVASVMQILQMILKH